MASKPTFFFVFLFISLTEASANSKIDKGPQSTLQSSGAPINLACRATQLPDLCKSSLSTKVAANAGAEDIIGAAMGLASDGAKQTHLLSQNLLATYSHNANVSAAAKNCLEFADSSIALIAKSSAAIGVEQRTQDVKAWMSAALAYVYDCSSDLRYVNTTHKISTVIQQVDWVTNLTSNALSMVDALAIYGKNMILWRPPTTERSSKNFSSTSHYYHLTNKNWNWNVLEVNELLPDVTVSKLDHKSSISSIQQAVNSAPDYSEKRFVIKIEAGVYEETVRIPRSKTNLMFVGAGMDTTVITGSTYVPSLPSPVTIYDIATVGVDGDGFMARDITFRNTYPGPQTHQAVALRVDSDFSAFYNCAFESHQDTLGESTLKLPPVDIIITTTDPFREPAITTANTVVSVLAIDYPVQKFACYVSDDGASPITFYSLVETLRFAKKWVPFCRKFGIETRAPFVYFSKESSSRQSKNLDTNFVQEWQLIKDEYEDLKRRITKALETEEVPLDSICLDDGFAHGSSTVRNHSSVVKIIYENKGDKDDILPHLVYVAREKRPKINHHYKAGAMNAMAKVSGLMTNAPFIVNLDCDMFVSNSKAIQHAMCFFLDCKSERECGFVQFPQLFHGGLKDDPFGNQLRIYLSTMVKGMNGLQGPPYCGTGCFHRRKALYGVPPTADQYNNSKDVREIRNYAEVFHDLKASSWSFEVLRSIFGPSSALAASAQTIMQDTQYGIRSPPSSAIDDALHVSGCSYETNTAWGKEIGWMYGSTVEDVMTGLKVHSLGWHSVYVIPEQPVFLGNAPGNGPDSLVQQKRWATGLMEIFLSRLCPFLNIHRKIMVRQRLVYAYFNLWGIWSLATFCYAILPAFCLLSGKSFLPGISEPAFGIAVALFFSTYGFKLWEFLRIDGSIREWWNNQRMWLIQCLSPWIFAMFDVLMKLIGVSETVFVVTPKATGDEDVCNEGDFTFDSSALFIPPTTVLFINLVAIILGSVRSMTGKYDMLRDKLLAEYLCSVWVVTNLLPFVKGLVRKRKRGIPWSVVIKSAALALLLCTTWTQN